MKEDGRKILQCSANNNNDPWWSARRKGSRTTSMIGDRNDARQREQGCHRPGVREVAQESPINENKARNKIHEVIHLVNQGIRCVETPQIAGG